MKSKTEYVIVLIDRQTGEFVGFFGFYGKNGSIEKSTDIIDGFPLDKKSVKSTIQSIENNSDFVGYELELRNDIPTDDNRLIELIDRRAGK